MSALRVLPVRAGADVAGATLLAVVLLAMVVLQACGSDGESSADRTCAAKDELSTSIQTVVDDVKAGNLGDARDHLEDVRSRASDLASAVADLGSQERDKLEPQVEQLRNQVKSLTDATSVSELSAGLTAVTSSAAALSADLRDDLSCT